MNRPNTAGSEDWKVAIERGGLISLLLPNRSIRTKLSSCLEISICVQNYMSHECIFNLTKTKDTRTNNGHDPMNPSSS